MKLLFCDNTIWGLCNFREPVFRHFHERGHDIVLVAPADEGSQMKANVPAYARHIPVHLARTGRNPLSDISYMRQLYSIYRRERPDYIFHYTIKPNIYGTLAARLCGIPSTAMVAGLGYVFSSQGAVGNIARGLYRFGLRYAQHVFVLNRNNYDTMLAHKICSSDKIILLKGGEGVETKRICETAADDDNTFMMVARLLYDKGYTEYVEAAKLLKSRGMNARFQLLGTLDEAAPNSVRRETLEDDVAKGYVEYLGFSTSPMEIMGKASVIVLPSNYKEGLNRSLMEACALGKPIITTDIPGCRETVEDGKNGYLVPVKDAQALAGAMTRYLSLDADAKAAMGHASRTMAVERFDISHVIGEYERIVGQAYPHNRYSGSNVPAM